MAKTERVREGVTSPPGPDYWKHRLDAGWRLSAVEWEREIEVERTQEQAEEIPYGLKISADCARLEVNKPERDALMLMLELIVQDRALSQVAHELNERGFRTRRGLEWSSTQIFNLLPRMIEVGPRVFSEEDWAARRRRLFKAS
jgi:hypothetical protein